jgi:hypothetical protein
VVSAACPEYVYEVRAAVDLNPFAAAFQSAAHRLAILGSGGTMLNGKMVVS